VPATYEVVETPTAVIDHHYGFISVPGRPKISWSFGFSEAQPLCHKKCKTIWQRTEVIGGHPRVIGLREDGGGRALFVVDELISFRVEGESAEYESHLRDTAGRYHRREEPEKCLLPRAP
jgi:hypothetical protein